MNIIELILIGIGLAMDAFAVSICKGLSIKKINLKKEITVGLYFGFFQSIMPLIGFLLGNSFEKSITSIDHWISFILLLIIGLNMISEVFSKEKETFDDKVDFKTMVPFAIATSIDSLAVGITFAFLKVNILIAILLIDIITLVISFIDVKIGNKVRNKSEKHAQFFGGLILILIGLKILLEHLGII